MIREPAVAGQFYDANPKSLREAIRTYGDIAADKIPALGVLAPHAGYVYSGAVAGAVYGSVRLPNRFIILGPNHTGRGAKLSLHPEGQWRTPLGLVDVDTTTNEQLLKECAHLASDKVAHAREHSIEVQIPFLQTLAEAPRFAAICVGTSDYATIESLGHALARVVRSLAEPVLLVASSDMSHYESAETAARKDRYAIDRMASLDPEGLHRTVLEKDISMCGFAPAVALLIACRDLGATGARLIRYANSGDVSGDRERVVGYAGMAIS